LELNWLRSFLSVARTRSFSASARESNITQPAFSRRIKALEHWAGVPLIDRSTYPPRLTSAGERFLETARDIEARMTDLRSQMAREHRGGSGVLRIAAQHTLAFHHLPPALLKLRTLEPDLFVELHASNIHDCLEVLQEGAVDFLLAYHVESAPIMVNEEVLQFTVLGSDRLLPVIAPDEDGRPLHPFPGSQATPTPWLSYGRDAMLDRVLTVLLDSVGPLHLRPVAENAISEVLRRLALTGLGVAWLPESLIANDLDAGRLLAVGEESYVIPMEVRGYYAAESRGPQLDTFLSVIGSR
jgi:DNA-binding transcriptional LysR family regulator